MKIVKRKRIRKIVDYTNYDSCTFYLHKPIVAHNCKFENCSFRRLYVFEKVTQCEFINTPLPEKPFQVLIWTHYMACFYDDPGKHFSFQTEEEAELFLSENIKGDNYFRRLYGNNCISRSLDFGYVQECSSCGMTECFGECEFYD